MSDLRGKVAFVTGVSTGIGEAISMELVKNGMIVVGIARREDRLKALEEKLNKEKGDFHGIQADVTIEDDILKVFKFIKEKFGVLHVLINNAGVARVAPLADGDTKSWREIIDTNVIGLSICTREAVRLMKASDVSGYIIHVNSIAGHGVAASWGPIINIYAASKHAVTALTKVLRFELLQSKSKIRVTSISPGYVDTDIMIASGLGQSEMKTVLEDAPALKSEDIADAVVFLLTRPERVEIAELTIKPHGETS